MVPIEWIEVTRSQHETILGELRLQYGTRLYGDIVRICEPPNACAWLGPAKGAKDAARDPMVTRIEMNWLRDGVVDNSNNSPFWRYLVNAKCLARYSEGVDPVTGEAWGYLSRAEIDLALKPGRTYFQVVQRPGGVSQRPRPEELIDGMEDWEQDVEWPFSGDGGGS